MHGSFILIEVILGSFQKNINKVDDKYDKKHKKSKIHSDYSVIYV